MFMYNNESFFHLPDGLKLGMYFAQGFIAGEPAGV
jgi:hypothetical protein